MKNFPGGSPITTLIILLTLVFTISCSVDKATLNDMDTVFLNIPDPHFETKLIELGIDSDGVVNQKMLRSDAEKLSRLDLSLSANTDKITS